MQKNRAYNAHPELGVGRVFVTKDNILDDIANKASDLLLNERVLRTKLN